MSIEKNANRIKSKTAEISIQLGNCLRKGTGDLFRKHGVQVAPGNTGAVGRLYAAGACTGNAVQEISNQLGRCMVIAAAGPEGCFFDFLLPVHTGQRTLTGEVSGV